MNGLFVSDLDLCRQYDADLPAPSMEPPLPMGRSTRHLTVSSVGCAPQHVALRFSTRWHRDKGARHDQRKRSLTRCIWRLMHILFGEAEREFTRMTRDSTRMFATNLSRPPVYFEHRMSSSRDRKAGLPARTTALANMSLHQAESSNPLSRYRVSHADA